MKNIPVTSGPCDISPGEAGFHPPVLEKLNGVFKRLIDEEKLQCAGYLLARRGKIFAHAALGRLLPDAASPPYQPDSLRMIASSTKVFTAVGLMQLAERGLLTIEQPAADFIKEFDTDLHRGIKLSHLLTHTSGLAPDPGFSLEPYPVVKYDFKDMDEFLSFALRGPLHSEPGARWAYCTNGFVILGEVIARASGMPYETYIQKNILEPLGLNDTHYNVPPGKRNRVCFTEPPAPGFWERPDLLAAGGGLYSTLRDLHRFGQMMLDSGTLGGVRILSRKSVEAMTTNRLHRVPADAWDTRQDAKLHGWGWSLEYRSTVTPGTYGHEGSGRVNLVIDPAERLVAVYFVPTAVPWVPESLLGPLAIIWSGLE